MKILSVDYGDVRTGLAVCDELMMIATPLPAVKERTPERVAARVAEEARRQGAERILLGFPKNMNNTIGPRGEHTQEFAKILEEEARLPVILWDERLTTVSALSVLRDTGVKGKKKKEKVDSLSAAILLENYLNFINMGGKTDET